MQSCPCPVLLFNFFTGSVLHHIPTSGLMSDAQLNIDHGAGGGRFPFWDDGFLHRARCRPRGDSTPRFRSGLLEHAVRALGMPWPFIQSINHENPRAVRRLCLYYIRTTNKVLDLVCNASQIQ